MSKVSHGNRSGGFFQILSQMVHSDGGAEYVNKSFWDQPQSDGTHEISAPYMLEQNGLAEKMNQILFTLANMMLSTFFWADAMATTAYVTAWISSLWN